MLRLGPQIAGTNTPTGLRMHSSPAESNFCELHVVPQGANDSHLPCRLVNAFAFWQGQDIGNATATYLDDLAQAFAHIEDKVGSNSDIEIWNGETGWSGTG